MDDKEKDPVLERNFLIFMVLTMALIFGWMYFFGKYQAKNKPPAKPQPVQTQPGSTSSPQAPAAPAPAPGGTAAQGSTTQAAPAAPKPGAGIAPPQQFPAKSVTVSGPLYRINFSSKGAVPTSWELNKYLDRVYYPIEVSIKWPPITKIAKFTPVPINLINPELASKPTLRSKIIINNMPVPADAVWQTDQTEVNVSSGPADVVFTLPLSQGITLKKIYTFYPDKYQADLKFEFDGVQADPKTSEVDLGMSYIFEPLNRLARINFHGPIMQPVEERAVTRVSLSDLNKGNEAKKEKIDWAGFTDSYFLTALLAPKDAPMDIRAYYSGDTAALNDKNSDKEYSLEFACHPDADLVKQNKLADLTLYFGPKERDILMGTRNSLGLAIDYGWFAILAMPMMYILKAIDKVVKNYGWSIILFTFILRMLMFPLTRMSQRSMKELQKLQPEMDKIRKKYPDDRMKQQEEIYALQRKYKINPMGGCLPMVVQIPIFFAFYKVLVVSIELRQAPWILWIPDLSVRDPLLILPLLMGVSQFVMQKLTPTAGVDPAQARMMQFMPLVFTVMLIYFPAGLLLYWTVSNIIGIAQQIYVMRADKAANPSLGQPG